MIKYFLTLVLSIFLLKYGKAQNVSSIENIPSLNWIPKNHINFQNHNPPNSSIPAYKKNVIKIDIIQTIINSIVITYERVLNQKFSLELGVGPSLRDQNNFKLFEPFGQSKIGFYASPLLKMYLKNKPRGTYIGFGTSYANSNFKPLNNSKLIKSSIQQIKSFDLFKLQIGVEFTIFHCAADLNLTTQLFYATKSYYHYDANTGQILGVKEKRKQFNSNYLPGLKIGIRF